MSDTLYILSVKFKSHHDQVDAFKIFLRSIVGVAFESPGCLQHDLVQSTEDACVFMFYERWENQAAHAAHIARPEVKTWRAELEDYLEIPYEVSQWRQ